MRVPWEEKWRIRGLATRLSRSTLELNTLEPATLFSLHHADYRPLLPTITDHLRATRIPGAAPRTDFEPDTLEHAILECLYERYGYDMSPLELEARLKAMLELTVSEDRSWLMGELRRKGFQHALEDPLAIENAIRRILRLPSVEEEHLQMYDIHSNLRRRLEQEQVTLRPSSGIRSEQNELWSLPSDHRKTLLTRSSRSSTLNLSSTIKSSGHISIAFTCPHCGHRIDVIVPKPPKSNLLSRLLLGKNYIYQTLTCPYCKEKREVMVGLIFKRRKVVTIQTFIHLIVYEDGTWKVDDWKRAISNPWSG
mgnify:CR=1 FL=1